MIYLLDTNMVSFIINGRSQAARGRLKQLRSQDDREACVSMITVSEILYGLERVGGGGQRRKAIEMFFLSVSVYAWDYAAAQAYGSLRTTQERLGKSLGPYDMQIAAHAVALKATVVTHDSSFQRVPGLLVEDWATDL